MKKILIILVVIFFIFVGTIAIFVLTFDINRYKGVIIEKVSHAIGKDVALGRISLDFAHGLGCRVDGLALKEKDTGWDDAWLKAHNVQISVRILPLFKKDVQVNRIDIEGLDLRLSDELLRQPVQPSNSSQEKLDTGTIALGALKFLAKVIVIKDSVITYMPTKSEDTIKIGISALMLNNVSLSGPVQVNAVLSTLDKGKDNIVVKGIVFPELSSKSPYIKNFDLKLDANGVDLPGFLRTLGYTQAAGQLIDKKVHGIVIINSEKLFLDPNKIFDSSVLLKLSEFETDAVPLKGGVRNLTLDAELSGKDLMIKNCSGSVAGGNISASLTIKDLPSVINKKSVPYLEAVRARIDLDGLDVQSIASVVNNADVKKSLSGIVLKGIVSTQAEKLYLDSEKIWDSSVAISLDKCSLDILAIPGGIKDINLNADFRGGDINIRKLSAIIGGGTIVAQGIIKDLKGFEKEKKLPAIEDFTCHLNLADFDAPWLFKALGNDKLASIAQGRILEGNIVIKGSKLFPTPPDLYKSDVSVSISKLSTDIIGNRGVSDVDIEAHLGQGDLVIKKLSGIAAGGLISASGTIKNIAAVVSQKGTLETENVVMQFNLQNFNIPEIVAISGNDDLARILKEKTIAGKVTIKSDKFSLSQKEKSSGISILLSQGMTDLVPIQGGVKDIEFEAALEQNDLVVHKLTGSGDGGTFLIQGSVKNVFSLQLSSFDILCSGINLDSLLPQTSPGSPRFQGIADLKAIVAGQGIKQDQLMQSLTGSGSLKVNKPVLKNMNILRIAFDKMDMIPGLVSRLRENLSENYTEVLKQNDTNFKPMDITYTISQGKLIFKDATIESDGFLVKAQGEVGLLGDIQIGSYLFIAPDLSQAFINIVRELRFLANEEGIINMPLAITGKGSQVSVNIDRDYVLRKLIVSKGSELLENIFKKKDKSQEEPQSQPDESQQDRESSNVQQEKDRSSDPATLIKSIFDIIGSQDK